MSRPCHHLGPAVPRPLSPAPVFGARGSVMAQTYTLEEAADKLDLSVEELKRRLRTEWTQIRSFRDGATLRFRANEIDELARSMGLGSSEELPLADSGYDLPSPAAAEATPRKSDSGAPLKLDD